MPDELCGHHVGLFDISEVSGFGNDEQARAGDPDGDVTAGGGWCRRVPFTADHQRRRPDVTQARSQVHLRNRLAAPRVTLGRRLQKHCPVAGNDVGRSGLELRCEPASYDGIGYGGHPVAANDSGSLAIGIGGPQIRGGAQQRQALDPLRNGRGESHSDHAAERQPGVAETADRQPIEQAQHVAAEVVDAVRTGWHRGSAMPSMVEGDDAAVRHQRRDLRRPHLARRAERSAEHHDWCVRRPGDGRVQFGRHPRRRRCAATARSTIAPAVPSHDCGESAASTSSRVSRVEMTGS